VTIFDTIRYPITDIFDPDQVDHIPLPILIPWIRECAKFIGHTEDFNPYTMTQFSKVSQYMIVRKSIDSNNYSDDTFINCFKSYFTDRLREYIANYEGEYLPRYQK